MKIKQNRRIRAGDIIRFDVCCNSVKILDNGNVNPYGGLLYKAIILIEGDRKYCDDYLIGDEEQPYSKRRRLKYIIENEIANYPKKEIT